jgi:hypothetical protein
MEQWKRLLLPIVAGIGRRASAADDAVAAPTTTTTLEYEKDENCTREGKKREKEVAQFRKFFFFKPTKNRVFCLSVAIADLQRAIRRQGRELYDVHRVLGQWRVFEEHLM